MADISLNQYYMTGGALGQLTIEAGGDVAAYNQYGAGGVAEQLRVLVDPDMALDQYHAGGVAEQIVEVLESGGGSAPEWVPADAKIYIDLVGDRAWTEADGEVAIDTLLGADPNTENGWDTTEYNPVNLSEFGYTEDVTTTPLGLIGGLRTKVLAGCTMRLLIDREDASHHNLSFALVSADGNHAVEVDVQGGQLIAQSWDGPFNDFIADVANIGIGSKNAIAITTTPSRLEAAINGGVSILQGSLTTDEYPVSGDGAIVAGIIAINGTYLQSITIYDALPTTAGLSELSENS